MRAAPPFHPPFPPNPQLSTYMPLKWALKPPSRGSIVRESRGVKCPVNLADDNWQGAEFRCKITICCSTILTGPIYRSNVCFHQVVLGLPCGRSSCRKARPDGRGDRRAAGTPSLHPPGRGVLRATGKGPSTGTTADTIAYLLITHQEAGKPTAAARAVAPRCSFPSQRNHCRERVSSRQSTSSCPAIPIGAGCADGTEWRAHDRAVRAAVAPDVKLGRAGL
jgi:hypothetical protein